MHLASAPSGSHHRSVVQRLRCWAVFETVLKRSERLQKRRNAVVSRPEQVSDSICHVSRLSLSLCCSSQSFFSISTFFYSFYLFLFLSLSLFASFSPSPPLPFPTWEFFITFKNVINYFYIFPELFTTFSITFTFAFPQLILVDLIAWSFLLPIMGFPFFSTSSFKSHIYSHLPIFVNFSLNNFIFLQESDNFVFLVLLSIYLFSQNSLLFIIFLYFWKYLVSHFISWLISGIFLLNLLPIFSQSSSCFSL